MPPPATAFAPPVMVSRSKEAVAGPSTSKTRSMPPPSTVLPSGLPAIVSPAGSVRSRSPVAGRSDLISRGANAQRIASDCQRDRVRAAARRASIDGRVGVGGANRLAQGAVAVNGVVVVERAGGDGCRMGLGHRQQGNGNRERGDDRSLTDPRCAWETRARATGSVLPGFDSMSPHRSPVRSGMSTRDGGLSWCFVTRTADHGLSGNADRHR